MNLRHPFIKLAALGALVSALPLLMAPTGGYPSRPTFQGATIGSLAQTPTYVRAISSTAGVAEFDAVSNAGANTACLTSNNTGSAGSSFCAMPAGKAGLATTSVMFLHSSSASINTDSNVVENAAAGTEAIIAANVLTSQCAALEANASGTVGGCGMPAGLFGVASTTALYLHTGNGDIETDATVSAHICLSNGSGCPAAIKVWGQIIETATTCALQGTTNNLVSCTRTGVGAVTLTAAAGWSINNGCAYGDMTTGSFHFIHTVSTLSNGLNIAVASTAGAAVDVWSLYVSCS